MEFFLLPKTWVHMQLKLLITNMVKNLKIVLKKYTTDTIKNVSKKEIQETAEATSDLLLITLLIK